MKRRKKDKWIKYLIIITITMLCVMSTGCQKREEFRHGHRHRIGDPPIEEKQNAELMESEEKEVVPPAEEIEEEPESYAFEGLEEKFHPSMESACDEIKADKNKIRNFMLYNSSGDKIIYRFEYQETPFEVNFSEDGSVQYITTVPADGLLYRTGCKGLSISDFCVDKSKIPDIQAATEEAFEHGAIKADYIIDYYWDKAQISRVYDFYIVRVSGKAIYNYTERRTEPQIVCELKDFETVLNPRYFSVQNGERLEEFGEHEVPMCELEEK